jgi:hypothetical protein
MFQTILPDLLDIRNYLPVLPLLLHDKRITNKRQIWTISKLDNEDPFPLADQFPFNWFGKTTQTCSKTESSLDETGTLWCPRESVRGLLARLLVYFADKHLISFPEDIRSIILEWVILPVSCREIMLEGLYFYLQGDINPLVFIADREKYARNVLDRTNVQPIVETKHDIQVIDHKTIYLVHQNDQSEWIEQVQQHDDVVNEIILEYHKKLQE